MYKKILIAIDESDHANITVKKGLAMAKQLEAQTGLLLVIDETKAIGNPDIGSTTEEIIVTLKEQATRTLSRFAAQSNHIEKLMPEGKPAETIIKTAESWQADIIVIGSNSHSGIEGLLMSDVTKHVLHHAHIPVLVVPKTH